jgi:rare lipoprotein A
VQRKTLRFGKGFRVALGVLATMLALLPASVTPGDIDAGRHAAAWERSQAMRSVHGRASFYAASLHGRRTASGERYDSSAMTAAHRTLPLGAIVRVVDNGSRRAVLVRINDRGPYVHGRDIDLSRRAAVTLGITDRGVSDVTIEVVSLPG